MAFFLNNIKSTFILKLIANDIQYIRLLKIIKNSKLILKRLDITEEYFKTVSAVKRVIDPSYEIEKYYEYFKINNKKVNETGIPKKNSKKKIDVNEWTLYKCLNSSNFNIKLNITDKNFETIINNAYKINLIIGPDSIKYLINSSNEVKENIYNLLNRNIGHILELSICKLNHGNIKNILDLLNIIFKGKAINNKLNKEQFVKKFNLLDNYLKYEQNVILNDINNIISLKNISLNIDYNDLSQQQINEIEEFIEQNWLSLKSLELRITDYIEERKQYFNEILYKKFEERCLKLKKLFGLSTNSIQILNLSNYALHHTILNILNSNFKIFQLKELKLKIISLPIDIYGGKNYFNNWNFLLKVVDTLEVFELNIQNLESLPSTSNDEDIYRHFFDLRFERSSYLDKKKFPTKVCYYIGNFGNLISSLNLIKKLKYLKLNFILTGDELIDFKNFDNIEYLYVSLEAIPISLKDYFIKFKKIKSLVIYNKCADSTKEKKFQLIIPAGLDSLKLRNFDLEVINSILNSNKNNLASIKKLLVDYKAETVKDFRQLILYYLLYFKSLKKLSIYGISEQDCSSIFKVVPSLIEFNFKMFRQLWNNTFKFYDNLKSSMKKNIISFS